MGHGADPDAQSSPTSPSSSTWRTALRWLILAALLYLFFVSIKLLGNSFKGLGQDTVHTLLTEYTNNPFAGLLIGVFTTSLIQSSSTTTAILVGFVSGGVLDLRHAIPIVMGANIGSTITNLTVSMGHARHKAEFGRAFTVAIVHDIFNILTVFILLPLEIYTHYLERASLFMMEFLVGNSGMQFHSPLEAILKPTEQFVGGILIGSFGLKTGSIVMMLLALTTLITALVFVVKTMKSLVGAKIEASIDTIIVKHGYVAMLLGALITAIVQASSLTTSLLVPLAGAGLLTLEGAFPITLGANLGTTITALLASLAGNPMGLAIALCHLLFNITGTLIFYPLEFMRKIPLNIARYLSGLFSRKWYFALAYLLLVFFGLPFVGMLLFR